MASSPREAAAAAATDAPSSASAAAPPPQQAQPGQQPQQAQASAPQAAATLPGAALPPVPSVSIRSPVADGPGAGAGAGAGTSSQGRASSSEGMIDAEMEDELDSTSVVDEMRDGKANILVAVRVRPLHAREQQIGARSIVSVVEGKVVVLHDDEPKANDFLRAHRSRERRYAFDYAFEQGAPQAAVYKQTVAFLLEGVMNGYNATVFAYGATGAGKTHTMLGTVSDPGVMGLALGDLFRQMEAATAHTFQVSISYLEVYNEVLRDLLDPARGALELREDPVKGMSVAGISEVQATSAMEVISLLRMGNRNRTTEATAANETSSRSHAVLQIVVERRERTADTQQLVRVGKLSLIDLAGSERASVTQNSGIRMVEGANINRSLLALANCINALGAKAPGAFVPYRDSKLTRLLKDSLGGNCRTVMIANISPSSHCHEDTHNTLKYANRAKNIKTTVVRNVLNVSYHIAQYTNIIRDLRAEIAQLKRQLARYEHANVSARTSPSLDPVPNPASLAVVLGGSEAAAQAAAAASAQAGAVAAGVEQVRTQLSQSFEEVLQIKHSQVDVEDMIMNNRALLSKVDGELQWRAQRGAPEDAKRVGELRHEVERLQRDVAKDTEVRQALQRRLSEIMSSLADLMQSLPTIVPNAQARTFVELEYQMHVLEVEKIEQEEAGYLQDVLLRQRDMDLLRLEQQLELRDRLIAEQSQQLRKNGLPPIALPASTDSSAGGGAGGAGEVMELEQIKREIIYRDAHSELLKSIQSSRPRNAASSSPASPTVAASAAPGAPSSRSASRATALRDGVDREGDEAAAERAREIARDLAAGVASADPLPGIARRNARRSFAAAFLGGEVSLPPPALPVPSTRGSSSAVAPSLPAAAGARPRATLGSSQPVVGKQVHAPVASSHAAAQKASTLPLEAKRAPLVRVGPQPVAHHQLPPQLPQQQPQQQQQQQQQQPLRTAVAHRPQQGSLGSGEPVLKVSALTQTSHIRKVAAAKRSSFSLPGEAAPLERWRRDDGKVADQEEKGGGEQPERVRAALRTLKSNQSVSSKTLSSPTGSQLPRLPPRSGDEASQASSLALHSPPQPARRKPHSPARGKMLLANSKAARRLLGAYGVQSL
jgi:kinesin family protein 18/19